MCNLILLHPHTHKECIRRDMSPLAQAPAFCSVPTRELEHTHLVGRALTWLHDFSILVHVLRSDDTFFLCRSNKITVLAVLNRRAVTKFV